MSLPTTFYRLSVCALMVAGDAPGPATPVRTALPGDVAAARIFRVPEAGELVIDLAPVDLPARSADHSMAEPPVAVLEIPASGSIYGFRVVVVDSTGHELPAELVHHFNLIDPDHRELFLPISRRILAAGRETGAIRLPRLLFGLPLKRGDHVVASAMLENVTATSYRAVRTRLVMNFTPAGRPWPLFQASPWQLDVAFPVGDKSFTLPPGRSSRSYEGRPDVPGTIIGLGGHVHDYSTQIEFVDATTGEAIYRVAPVEDRSGHVQSVPVRRLYGWTRIGVHIVPTHTYRVTVYYDNPTGQSIPDGGMGVVGGLFIPDHGVEWPAADPHDSLYHRDYAHYMRLGGEMPMAGMSMPIGGHAHKPAPGHP